MCVIDVCVIDMLTDAGIFNSRQKIDMTRIIEETVELRFFWAQLFLRSMQPAIFNLNLQIFSNKYTVTIFRKWQYLSNLIRETVDNEGSNS